MPKGKWTPPEAGDAPAEVKEILKEAYAAYRDEHPSEDPDVKTKGAKIAWGAVHAAGWQKDAKGKWHKKEKPMSKKEMSQEIVIDAFKAGDYPQGKFGAQELKELAATYDPANYEAPILIGHLSDPSYKGKSAIPAYGWIGAVKVIGDHLKLVASQFSEQLKAFIKDGFYKKVSAAFFQPDDPTNPTPGKWHLHHLAFLGGTPPAVKGLEQLAFAEMRSVGVEFAEMETEVSEGGTVISAVEELGAEDTLKTMTEYCASFLTKCEDALKAEVDDETRRSRMNLAAFDMQSEVGSCIQSHFAFMDKLEGIGEKKGTEMSEKKSWLMQLGEKVQSIITKQKESDMDQKKEQEYQERIAALDTQVKEFAEKERLANEAKAKADADAAKAVADAADATLKDGIKSFCDMAVTEARMTPAMREKDEPLMFTLGKSSPDALKSFQEKYAKPVVELGEHKEVNVTGKGDNRPKVIQNAAKYVETHPKEFSGLSAEMAVSRAVYLYSTGQIKFEGTTNNTKEA